MDREAIKIVNWNACSLKSKNIEFVDFLNERHIDIAVITETHLKPELNVFLPDFRLVRLDRTSSGGGGVAIAARRNISCRLLPSFQLKIIEAIGVEVSTSLGPITIIAVYCPKQTNIRDGSAADLRRDIIKLTRRRQNFVIAGDLNAKHQAWGNSRRNQNGTILYNDLQQAHYNILCPDTPTRLSRSGAHATIDIFISNIGDNISQPIAYQELSSDHYPVVAEVGSSANRFQVSRRNYHRVNWQQYQRCVDTAIDYDVLPESYEEVDQCLQAIEEAISRAREQHVPASRQVSHTLNLDSPTKDLIRLRNTIRRQFQRSGLPHLKTNVNRLTKIIQARMVELRNNDFANKIRSLPDCAKPFWKMTKILKNKSRPIPPLSSVDHLDPSLLITPVEKANALGQHFVISHNLGQTMVSPHGPAVLEAMSRVADTPVVVHDDSRISADEVIAAIRSTKNMKAAGMDGVVNLELKNLSIDFFNHLTIIFNKCLELGYFPACWS